ncbi:MAG TPA: hypothetical protein VJT32_04095 [bacterium]|nr:hypothetical protein [bacterium]
MVNKADRGDADRAAAEIQTMLGLAPESGGWRAPVLLTVAADGGGVPEVLRVIDRHRAHLAGGGGLVRHRQARHRREIVEERLLARVDGARMDELAARVAGGELDPYAAADQVMAWGAGHE